MRTRLDEDQQLAAGEARVNLESNFQPHSLSLRTTLSAGLITCPGLEALLSLRQARTTLGGLLSVGE